VFVVPCFFQVFVYSLNVIFKLGISRLVELSMNGLYGYEDSWVKEL